MEFNISKICRVCMEDGVYDILTSIFDDDYSVHISRKIMCCASVHVEEGDGLPTLICNKCADKVNIAYQFKQQCESSDLLLRELLEKASKSALLLRHESIKFSDKEMRELLDQDKGGSGMMKMEALHSENLDAEMEVGNNETVVTSDLDLSHDSIADGLMDELNENDVSAVAYELSIEQDVFDQNAATMVEEIDPQSITESLMASRVNRDSYAALIDVLYYDDTSLSSTKDDQPLKRRTRRVPKKYASSNEGDTVTPKRKSMKIKCRVCGVSMSSNSMALHMRKVHNEQAIFCKICHKQFNEKPGLAGHMKTHAKTKLNCKVCDAIFFSAAKLYLHMQKIHHNIEQQAVILGSIEQDVLAINPKQPKPRKHVCPCGHAVLSPAKLIVHMRTHSKERPYPCTLCPKSFSEKSSLTSHMLTHSGVKNFHCKDCGRSFTHSSALRMHQRIHNGELPYTCSQCIRRFRSSGDMHEHVRRAHTFERPYACSQCALKFVSSSDLARHNRTHVARTNKRNHRPPMTQSLNANMTNDADADADADYNFNDCDDLSYEDDADDPDYGDHKPITERKSLRNKHRYNKYICEICSYSAHSPAKLQIHMRTHTKDKPFSCDVCNKCFAESGTLTKHMVTHTGEKKFLCDTCGKTFSSFATRKTHLRIHTGELPFECDWCDRKFRAKQGLDEHVRRAHTFEKPFQCKTCDRCFIAANQLILHERIHTGDLPYHCEICTAQFRTSDAANIHLKRHLGQKNYVCSVCNMSFVSTGELNRHSLKHSGQKPFECSLCGKRFARSDKLADHKQRLHTKSD